jgi:hypothetical protein
MATGNAALHLTSEPAPESKDASARVTAGKPDAGIEDLIGEVLTAISDVSVQAWREVQAGQMSTAIKTQGGDLVALLYQARQVLGGASFADVMHRQSRVLRQRRGVGLSQAEVSEITDELIAVVVRVDATMRAMAQTTNHLQ